jgi:hypothetical protein
MLTSSKKQLVNFSSDDDDTPSPGVMNKKRLAELYKAATELTQPYEEQIAAMQTVYTQRRSENSAHVFLQPPGGYTIAPVLFQVMRGFWENHRLHENLKHNKRHSHLLANKFASAWGYNETQVTTWLGESLFEGVGTARELEELLDQCYRQDKRYNPTAWKDLAMNNGQMTLVPVAMHCFTTGVFLQLVRHNTTELKAKHPEDLQRAVMGLIRLLGNIINYNAPDAQSRVTNAINFVWATREEVSEDEVGENEDETGEKEESDPPPPSKKKKAVP